jgi:MFS family permease
MRPSPSPSPSTPSYALWLAGSSASLLGDAALYFALGWAATAHGGGTAALVLTAITVPRTALLLLGGAVGDRFGARRVVIAGDAAMLAATLLLAVAASSRFGTSPWLLAGAAAVIGTVDAFYLPVAGSMARRLVTPGELPRALAAQQSARQTAALIGAPLGALLVAATGLGGVALADAATFAAVLLVAVRLRPAAEERSPDRGLLAEAADGVRLAVRDPLLRPALLLTAAAAGGLLPVVSLLSPLLVREHHWGAGTAGLVAAGQTAGVIAASLLVARRGTLRRTGTGAALGLCVAALGIGLLAAVPVAGVAVVTGTVIGVGSGMFATHIGPLVLAGAPETHLSRVQALLTLVQSLALTVSNNALGALADATTPATATAACAVTVAAAGLTGLARLAGPTGLGQRPPGFRASR